MLFSLLRCRRICLWSNAKVLSGGSFSPGSIHYVMAGLVARRGEFPGALVYLLWRWVAAHLLGCQRLAGRFVVGLDDEVAGRVRVLGGRDLDVVDGGGPVRSGRQR